MRIARCESCRSKMPNHLFNAHKCPATLEPLEGESWEDFSTRSREHARKWREVNLKKAQA